MKKTQILAAAALLLLAGACTKNFEQYNANPYGVTNEEMLRDGYALRAALNGMASAVISTDVNTTQFTECLLGGPMGGYLADSNQGFRNTISNFNPTDNWTNVLLSSDRIIPTFFANYGDVRNLTEDPVVLAIADVIKVAVLHRVADTYGPIPYSQIGVGGKIQVPYDSQEQAYKNMLADLDRSIAVLTANRGTTINASADIIYGGQVEKWAKFANSLKLRLAMRMVYADPATAKKAAEEVAAEVLPTGYSYDYQGLTREEAKATNSTALIFVLCFIFIYLILSAQYESYILPLAVVLSVPFGLAGCFVFTTVFGHANDIYMQISLIMLIGLLAKNAILIVQFALERRQTGMAISWSAVLGAAARLRPILMTSLAMVIGLLPMMFASGVGKNGNQTLGAAAVGGMLIGTILQLFVVPTLFVIFQTIQEKFKPLVFEDDENEEVAAELAQYAHAKPVDYELEK